MEFHFSLLLFIKSLPDNKILDLSKLKALSRHKKKIKLIVTQQLEFALGRVENFVGKRKNAGYQHFLLFPQCFQKASFSGLLNVWIV